MNRCRRNKVDIISIVRSMSSGIIVVTGRCSFLLALSVFSIVTGRCFFYNLSIGRVCHCSSYFSGFNRHFIAVLKVASLSNLARLPQTDLKPFVHPRNSEEPRFRAYYGKPIPSSRKSVCAVALSFPVARKAGWQNGEQRVKACSTDPQLRLVAL